MDKMDTSQPQEGFQQSDPQRKVQNFSVRRPRGNRGRSGRGKVTTRTDNWRDKQNQAATERYSAMRSKRSFDFPVTETSQTTPIQPPPPSASQQPEYEAVKFLGMAQTISGRPIPIATQALGFIVNQYYIKLQHQLGADRVTERCSIHQFYRHSLAQLSYHLYRLRIEQVPRYSYRTMIPDPPIVPPQALEAFKALELNVGFVTSYISRIGTVIAHDVPHVPMLIMDVTPLYVNIFTLRQMLLRANENDDFSNYFMAHNSVPGLQVRAGRIVNVNAIMPQDYDAATVYRDASAVRALMNYTASKMRDINIYTGRLGQSGEGNASMLLASSTNSPGEEDVHIPPNEADGLMPVRGTLESFWATVKLTDENLRLGVLGLYQREDISDFHFPDGNQWLLSAVAPYQISADYLAYLNRLIG